MPIYAYRCSACGHAKDVLRKVSDPLLSTCPACGAETFNKQVTAAGFQLKGSGWYATDFKGGSSSAKPAETAGDGSKSDSDKSDKSDKSGGDAKPGGGDADTKAAPAAATSAAAGCGTSCACH
jgi:putative FmdB family regulatory protein